MKIAVCDDEKMTREHIAQMIKTYTNQAEVYTFSSGSEMMDSREDFDIIFLDIEMKIMSGMEVAKCIRERQRKYGIRKNILIFVTAYREYMEEAFDVNAYHYIVKPVEEQKFIDVLKRAMNEDIMNRKQENQYIIIKNQGIQTKIYIKNILYMESSNKKIIIHTTNSDKNVIQFYGKMEEMDMKLKDTFFRCHRCYLVNMEKIKAYNVDTIQLVSGDRLILAQKKYTEFVKKYLLYAKDGGIVNV